MGKKEKTLSSLDMDRLIKEGYTFRQRQLYSKGIEGDIPVYYELRGPMWMRKSPKRNNMYSKTATKSYARDTCPKRSYKRNVLPVGAASLTSKFVW